MKKIIAIAAILLLVTVSTWAGPKISKNGGGSAGTGDVSTDAVWDAAGDIIYGTGANTGDNLAIGTAYQVFHVNSGATAPEWTSTLGATGTRLTKGWFTDLDVTNAITGAVTGTASGNIPNTLADAKGDLAVASADNTWGRLAVGATNTLLYVNSDTPAWLALGAANTVLTSNGSALTWASSHSHSDSAAQFYDASATTSLVKIDPTAGGAGYTATMTFPNTADATYTFPTATSTLATLGANTFTGNQTLDDGTGASPTLTFQDATNETAVFEKADAGFLTITTVAGDGVNIVTGNFKVGNGAPTQTQDGEDAYIEGMLEVDGVIYADGGITGATASDPYIKLDETDGTDWWIGVDDTGNSLEFRTNVAVGNTVRMELYESTGLLVTPPAAQTIEAGNTIAANACGTIKIITSAGDVTTNTTNTFTEPAATNAGCCMDVINTGANTITLDVNTNFVSAGAANVALGAGDTVRVCSTGASGKWYQIGATGNN